MNRDATGTLADLADIDIRNRAIVIGAGIGGLLAARVLSDHFDHVIVLDRDTLPDRPQHRRNAPQGQHVHALLARGHAIIERLFPGIGAELVQAGAIDANAKGDLRWFQQGGYFRDPRRGMAFLLQSRPMLEHHLRRRVIALPNVSIFDGCRVHGLLATRDGQRVTGVRVTGYHSETTEHDLAARLTIDASGRGSHLPSWLADLGYEIAPQVSAGVEARYATRTFKRMPGQEGVRPATVIIASPMLRRGGVMVAQEGNRWIVSLSSRDGSRPPTELSAFADWARSLEAPDIYNVVRHSTPLDDGVTYRFPRSTRWHYERMEEFPSGVLPFADAICSFNPVYAQGMSVAAIEAEQLSACLATGADDLARRFLDGVTAPIESAWMMAAAGDLRYVDAPINLPRSARLVNAYMSRLLTAAQRDPVVAEAFHRVTNLIEPPSALRRPSIALRVAFAPRHRNTAPAGVDRDSPELVSEPAG